MAPPTSPRETALDLLARYYAAFNAGRHEDMLALLTADVVHHINQGETETGSEAFQLFLQRMDRCYSEQIHDLVLFANETGTRAAAEFTVHGQYLETDEGLPDASGQRYTLPAGCFFTMEDNKIGSVTLYYNLQDWLKQIESTPA